ncbi:DNA helicase [Cronobacter phage S13]|jgi:superfamily II DNA or RNA helicase|uniref:Helicase ATP-binding domain-containing protein n=1 Tax=Cronobacter phage LPCS28 TaxID=2924885 RepID=A0AAE9GD56_9CAUD|nr:DNA helicase [Cronobacter phage S13]YP_010665910.1 hypothetical protein PQB73_gp114 [Cronobacter phage LPCS28]AIA64858.1 putative RNA-DNA and DNA-DNA helicase/ATPase [Cronobacter phage S13]UNY47099.1 hypothetical protein EHEKIMEA_00217 [Cronobacter phage LPCS28]
MKYDIKVLFQDYSHAKIEASNSLIMEIREYFSFDVEGARFNPKFKWGSWDGKIRLMDNNGNLPIGLVSMLVKFANENDYNIYVDDSFQPEHMMTRPEFDSWIEKLKIYAGQNEIKPYYYQADSVFEAINGQRRTLNLPTSAGKSLIQSLIARWYCENLEGKILMIVPTTALVDQMIDDFTDYRLFPRQAMLGIRGGTKRDSDALVYVSTWQTACKQPAEWFKQFGCLMVDECHLATGAQIGKIVKNMVHCRFKFGLSGSLKDGKSNVLQYIGMFGQVFRPVTTKTLMEEGQVSELKINSVFLRYTDEESVIMKGSDYQKEIKYITEHKKRNAWICRLALKLASKNENSVIMFKNIKHGKLLYEALSKKHDKVFYVSGETDTDTRTALKKAAELDSGMIIVASYGVMSTGISIKNLHHVVFAHPIKSKILVLQSIGRVLRLHGSKAVATLWDIVDDMAVKTKSKTAKKKYSHLNYGMKHGLDRIQRYNDEKFDYHMAEVIL